LPSFRRTDFDHPPQEAHPRGHVRLAVLAGLALDDEPAAVVDLGQGLDPAEPVDVPSPQGDFLGGAVGGGAAGVLGVGVDNGAVQRGRRGVGVEAVHQQVRRVEVHSQAAGVECGKVGGERLPTFQARLQGHHHPDAVAVRRQRLERLSHDVGPRVLVVGRDRPGGDDHPAGTQVVTETHRLHDALEARLLVLGRVQAAAEGAPQGGQLDVVPGEEVLQFAAGRGAELLGGQVADRVELDATDAHLAGLDQGGPQGQVERLQADTEAEVVHGSSGASSRRGEKAWVN